MPAEENGGGGDIDGNLESRQKKIWNNMKEVTQDSKFADGCAAK